MTDLRKLSNHPLLLRFYFDIDKVREIAKLLARDPGYKDTEEQYIIDDLVWMSDFEIHTLVKDFKVSILFYYLKKITFILKVYFQCLKKFELSDELMLTSGKFILFDKMLPDLKEQGHRVLIFSQYVIMLNIVEEYLRIRNYKFLRLDGSTAVTIR